MSDQTPSPADQQPQNYSTSAVETAAVAPGYPVAPPLPHWDPAAVTTEVRDAAKRAGQSALAFGNPVPEPWMAPHLGENGLPAGVARINWGAMLLGFWWALAYGMQRWAALAFVVNFGGNQLSRFLPEPVGLLIAAAQLAFAIWFGLSINRAYWAINPKLLTVEEFNRKQPKWVGIGALVVVLVFALLFSLSFV